MNIFDDDSDRHVVPRWRFSKDAARAPEILSPQQTQTSDADYSGDVAVRLQDFIRMPSIGTAADLLGTAMIAEDQQSIEITIRYILDNAEEAPIPLLKLAKNLSGGGGSDQRAELTTASRVAIKIAETRNLLEMNPRSAALWSDLARCQAILGQDEKAERTMKVALQLAPQSRWILRSAVRLLLHIGNSKNGKKELAHMILARSPLTVHDPWLMASEVATAQVISSNPKFWKQAKTLVNNSSIRPVNRSELAAAIATVEMASGNNKIAKKLFHQSLIDPTENVLAQAKWAEPRVRDNFNLNAKVKATPDAYEACFRQKYTDGQMVSALRTVENWLEDEPFSYMPTAMKSYVACLLDDYDTAIKTINSFKAGDAEDHGLSNNRDFAEISKGEIFADQSEVIRIHNHIQRRLQANGSDMTQALANAGLLEYRLGNLNEGRQFYELAMATSNKLNEPRQTAAAAMYHAREAVLAGAEWADEVLKNSHVLAEQVKNPQIKYYMRKIDAVHDKPDQAADIFSPKSANKFEESKVDYRVEKTEKGDVIVIRRRI